MAPTLTYQRELSLADEADTMDLGERIARNLVAPQVIFLHGELGAGKTTFSRGFLRGRGHAGSVKSPTYTLVEPYEETMGGPVYHLDLYRLGDAHELAFLGLEDYLSAGGYLLIEWPERAPTQLPAPTITLSLSASGTGRLATVCADDVGALDGLAC